jgi:hypothetical protein
MFTKILAPISYNAEVCELLKPGETVSDTQKDTVSKSIDTVSVSIRQAVDQSITQTLEKSKSGKAIRYNLNCPALRHKSPQFRIINGKRHQRLFEKPPGQSFWTTFPSSSFLTISVLSRAGAIQLPFSSENTSKP